MSSSTNLQNGKDDLLGNQYEPINDDKTQDKSVIQDQQQEVSTQPSGKGKATLKSAMNTIMNATGIKLPFFLDDKTRKFQNWYCFLFFMASFVFVFIYAVLNLQNLNKMETFSESWLPFKTNEVMINEEGDQIIIIDEPEPFPAKIYVEMADQNDYCALLIDSSSLELVIKVQQNGQDDDYHFKQKLQCSTIQMKDGKKRHVLSFDSDMQQVIMEMNDPIGQTMLRQEVDKYMQEVAKENGKQLASNYVASLKDIHFTVDNFPQLCDASNNQVDIWLLYENVGLNTKYLAGQNTPKLQTRYTVNSNSLMDELGLCSNYSAGETTTDITFLKVNYFHKRIVQRPESFFPGRRHDYSLQMDVLDRFGQNYNKIIQKNKGSGSGVRNLEFRMMLESTLTLEEIGNLTMSHTAVQAFTLDVFFAKIGGFHAVIGGLTALFMGFGLERVFDKKNEEDFKKHHGTKNEGEEVGPQLKHCVSYQGMFKLHAEVDRVANELEETKGSLKEARSEIQELKSQMQQALMMKKQQ